ncbi:hypothetical protein KUCAC02_033789 [Chaenocephalus aceratus]|nr:hypothetical protein KUCAC02_033789 [Chaenocephalus aceratus]
MEWDQCSGEKLLETQQSYETEWDMINAASFKRRSVTNGEEYRRCVDSKANPVQEELKECLSADGLFHCLL